MAPCFRRLRSSCGLLVRTPDSVRRFRAAPPASMTLRASLFSRPGSVRFWSRSVTNATRARPRSQRVGSRSIAGPRSARAGRPGQRLCLATWIAACSIRRSRPPMESSPCLLRPSFRPRSSPTSASGLPWGRPTPARERKTKPAVPDRPPTAAIGGRSGHSRMHAFHLSLPT